MGVTEERRRWGREQVPEPELGMVLDNKDRKTAITRPENIDSHFFIGIHNISKGGFLIESCRMLGCDQQVFLMRHNSANGKWTSHHAQVVWSGLSSGRNNYLAGLSLLPPDRKNPARHKRLIAIAQPLLADINFLLETTLLEYIPTHGVWPLLNWLQPMSIDAGIRFIAQGDGGDYLYIIQRGSCSVKVLKGGVYHQIARLGPGDVVGEMAVLTDELRCANVDARTDMRVWRLHRKNFEPIARDFPDLRIFLTELVTRRLEKSKIVADRTIGKYVVKLKLAQGGWSIVYHGVHQILNMPVAIKMLKHQMAMDACFQDRFREEAKLIAKLNHRNIVHVYDIEELYHTLFIIMEYLEGESLASRLARTGALPVPQCVDILMQICSGLEYAHHHSIIHYDIKPANIHILPDGQVKILDFGLSFIEGNTDPALRGTVEYIAPEQIRGEQADHRVDIYTLGLTAFEMVTGSWPHATRDISTLLKRRQHEEIPDPAGLAPDGLPEVLRSFITKACRRQPDERHQTMTEALQALQSLHQDAAPDSRRRPKSRKISALHFVYQDEQQRVVNRLLEEVCIKAHELGITIKSSEIGEV